jgi:hypothetical protein
MSMKRAGYLRWRHGLAQREAGGIHGILAVLVYVHRLTL